jgi:hypothetical protein
MNMVLSALLVGGFSIVFVIDILVLYTRYSTGLVHRNAVGSYFMQILLLISRFGVVLLMPAAAALVDLNINTSTLIFLYAFSAIIALLSIGLLLRYRLQYFKFIVHRTSRLLRSVNIPNIEPRSKRIKFDPMLGYFILIVSFVNAVGLSAPMIIASHVSEWKLMVSHLGAIINSIATIINVVYLEGVFTKMLERHRRAAISYVDNFIKWKLISLIIFAFTYTLIAFLYQN